MRAIDILSPQRFDVTAKTLYLKLEDYGFNTDFHRRLYEHHLNVWNGVRELNPPKVGIKAYTDSFKKISDDVRNDNFDFTKSPLLVCDGHLYNGSHRLASAIYHNKEAKYANCKKHQGELMSCERFLNYKGKVPTGLGEDWADAMTLEYVRVKKGESFVATLFPRASGKDEQVEAILKKYGCKIIRKKNINMTGPMPYNYMRQTYYGESWAGNKSNNYRGFRDKAKLCFGEKGGMTRVFVFETKNPKSLPKCKKEIRDLYGIQNHSVHINDRHDETMRIAGMFFNKNSIQFLKRADLKPLDKFDNLFSKFVDWIYACQDEEKFCVDASAVLSAYGLRDCRDLDFLKSGVPCVDPSTEISRHNEEAKYYDRHIDEIIWNPNNHFYYCGIKFATPEVMIAMKKKRNEEKDKTDVQLLKGIL
jgi:hypothetical protein